MKEDRADVLGMKNLLAVVVLFLLCSCAWSAEGLRDAYPSWTEGDVETVLAGKIRVGMTEDQVRAAWGSPKREHRMLFEFGEIKYLHYYRRTVHVRDGRVDIISTR